MADITLQQAQQMVDAWIKTYGADTGKVFDGTFICRENGGRQNCHSGILGAADNDIAVQGLAPMNHKLFQAATLLLG